MSRYKFSWVLLILLLTGFVVLLPSLSILATADTIDLYPAADTFIVSNQPDTNFGSNTGLMVGKLGNTGLLHARIRFSGIPAGASIQSAYLRLYRTMGSGSHTLAVQSASRSWQESTLTWNTDGSTNRWTTPNSTYAMSNQTGYLSVNVTSHVQEWADGSRSNYGFHLSTDGTTGENHTFASKESGTSSYRPRLEITYTPSNVSPTIDVTQPSSNITVAPGDVVTISWNGTDPDDAALVHIYYDEDQVFDNGNDTNIVAGKPEDGSYSWDTSSVPEGQYYIYCLIQDSDNYDYDYASGSVTVSDGSAVPDIRIEPTSLNFTEGATVMSGSSPTFNNESNLEEGLIRGESISTNTSITLPISIMQKVVIKTDRDGDYLKLDGFSPGGSPGDPELPSKRFTFLLPANVDLDTVEAHADNIVWEDILGEYDISPVCPPAASTGAGTETLRWGNKNPESIINGRDINIYKNDAWFPIDPLGLIVPSKYRHWNLGRISLWPISYNPVKKKIRLLRSAKIIISFQLQSTVTDEQGKQSETMRFPVREKFWDKISPELENPNDRDDFYPETSDLRSESYGPSTGPSTYYVIITTNDINSSSSKLSEFASHKESMGYNVAVITEGSAADESHYLSGDSTTSRVHNIRDWLQEKWESWGIEYVLLIGNPHPTTFSSLNSIPMLMCYPYYTDSQHYTVAPTDMCFAELSEDWDKDGDGHPGEYSGDFGTSGIDKDCEVAVGRIPYYGSISDLDSILQKIIDYATDSGNRDWREKLLIPAAISNHAPQDHNGDGDANDSIDEEWPNSSYRTFGADWGETMKSLATDNGYEGYTLYEKSGCYTDGSAYPLTACDASLTQPNVQSEWQNNYGFVAWWGHGNSSGAYRRIWTNDNYDPPGNPGPSDHITQHTQETESDLIWSSLYCSRLNNDHPSFVVQVSCTNGYPENSNNLGYSLLRNGAIATVSSSRVSWYKVGSWSTGLGNSYGDNASYAYQIFRRMIESEERIGDALNNSKREFGMGWAWQSWMNCLDFNLYGDPGSTQKMESSGSNIFTIYNDGDANLEITSMTKRDGDAWLSWSPTSPLTISPEGSQIIAVNVDWNQIQGSSDEERIIIYSNDSDKSPYPNAVFINATKQNKNLGFLPAIFHLLLDEEE